MIASLLSIVVPITLFILLLYKFRGTSLYLCAILVLMSMGRSAFLNSTDFNFSIPFLPFTLNWINLEILIFSVIAIYTVNRYSIRVRILKRNILSYSIIAYSSLILFHIPIAWITAEQIKLGVLWSSIGRLAFPIFVMLWIVILKRSNYFYLSKFIDTISWISVVLGVFYILNSTGVSIYSYEVYRTYSMGNDTIVRDFVTKPPWMIFAFSWFLAKKDSKSIFGLGILFLVGVFTYTRSIIFAMAFALILSVLLTSILKRKVFLGIVRIVLLGLILYGFVYFVKPYIQGNIQYIFERFKEFEETDYKESSLFARFQSFEIIQESSQPEILLLGTGFRFDIVGQQAQIISSNIPTVLGDSLWVLTLFFYGMVGVVLLASIYIAAILSTLMQYLKAGYKKTLFEEFLFLSMTMLVMLSFTGASHLYINPFPTAFVIALILIRVFQYRTPFVNSIDSNSGL